MSKISKFLKKFHQSKKLRFYDTKPPFQQKLPNSNIQQHLLKKAIFLTNLAEKISFFQQMLLYVAIQQLLLKSLFSIIKTKLFGLMKLFRKKIKISPIFRDLPSHLKKIFYIYDSQKLGGTTGIFGQKKTPLDRSKIN